MLWNRNSFIVFELFLFGFCQGAGEGQEEDMKNILETLKRLDSYIRMQLNQVDNDLADMWTNFDDLREKMDGLNNSQKALVEKVEESQMAVHGKVEEMDDKFTEKFGDLRETLDVLNDQLLQLQESSQSENQLEIFAEILKLDRDLQRDIWNNSCRADHMTQLQTNFSTELQKIERSMEGCSSVEQQLSNLTMVLTKDDCAEGSHRCSPLAVCEDAIVSYRCICLPGMTGDGFTCEDVDECASVEDRCHEHAECRNIIGNYTCACNPGFDGDGFNCRDVDECASVEDRCHEHAECRNIIGNYTCSCNPGFDGDGFNCRELPPCVHPYVNIPGIKGCLILVEESKTWIEASRHCSDGGGRLVEGWDSIAQSELLSDYVNKALGYTSWVWVGAQDRRWTEGKADIPSVLFRESDPTTHYLKDRPYAYLNNFHKRLYDYDDSLSWYFVCQRTSPPHPHNNDHNDD